MLMGAGASTNDGDTVFVAFLDKAWPPDHSFVSGMLAGDLARQPGIRVRLCVSTTPDKPGRRVSRYGAASCVAALRPRRGLGRLVNFLLSFLLGLYMVTREKSRGRRVVLFVRNDPVCVLAASLLRNRADRLIFQSSFPHEHFSGSWVKSSVARLLYRVSSRSVDAITAVTPEGLQRLRDYFPDTVPGQHIPLLLGSGFPFVKVDEEGFHPDKPVMDFVYAGTHVKKRELELSLAGAVKALRRGNFCRFRFIGSDAQQRERLRRVDGVASLESQGLIVFEECKPRPYVLAALKEADVGLSPYPCCAMHREASPTKLSEYMGSGLAVLASRGVPMQDRIVRESGGGILVDLSADGIAQGIEWMVRSPETVAAMQLRAAAYARTSLRYIHYVPTLMQLAGMDCRAATIAGVGEDSPRHGPVLE